MCGINGANRCLPGVVEGMNRATQHRGPDQNGIYSEFDLTIGNNRLAILDLTEAGRQPFISRDGRYVLVFNGEIYNYLELRRELEATGLVFRGHSDTEVLVEGYAKWGRAVVDKLRGMWAFCILDRHEKTVFFSRDPFGIKPLYIFYKDGSLIFSSEIKGILANPDAPRRINPEAVNDLLLMGYILAPKTILTEVAAFLPGECRLIDLEKRSQQSWILPLSCDASPVSMTDEELQTMLEDSVKAHLISDVPVGLFFSGGIDSTVLAVMLKRLGVGLKAFHVAIQGRQDTPYARQIAQAMGLKLIEVPFSFPDQLARYWSALDQPMADSSLLPTMAVAEAAAREVKVVLSGEGGDELFAGYKRHERMSKLAWPSPARSRDGFSLYRSGLRHFPWMSAYLPYAQGGMRRLSAGGYHDLIGSFIAETAIGGCLIEDSSVRKTIAERVRERETCDGALAADRLIYLPDDLLMKIDVMTMASSLEARVPFLDRNVFARVGGQPLDWKLAAGISKAPLKRILKNNLPPDLVDRPKGGFSVPLNEFIFQTGWSQMAEALQWYEQSFGGLAPGADAVYRWLLSLKDANHRAPRILAYNLFAVLTLYQYVQRHQLKV